MLPENKIKRLYNSPLPIVALTGGIATGKSTVAQLFLQAQIPVIDADKLVKQIYAEAKTISFIAQIHPQAIHNNTIDFQELRRWAFLENINLTTLENFIYAQMPDRFTRELAAISPHSLYLIYDVPLLFEKKLNELVDLSICVYAPPDLQKKRIINRDKCDEVTAEKILLKQWPIDLKKDKADRVLFNDSTPHYLEGQFQKLILELDSHFKKQKSPM